MSPQSSRADDRRRSRRIYGFIEHYANGSEDHYSYDRTVERHGGDGPERFSSASERDLNEDEQKLTWAPCSWPTRTEWRVGTCSRTAPWRGYGEAFCWQHEDMAFDHVLLHLERGAYYIGQVERLTEALLGRRFGTRAGTADEFICDEMREERTSAASRLAQNELSAYLRGLLGDDARYMPHDIQELVDQLIQKRLQQNWGATA